MERYYSKKFAVALLLIVVTTLLALTSKLTGDVANIFTGIGIMFPAAQAYADSKTIK